MPFRAVPAGDMFQKKIVELFSGMQNVFGFADDILIAGFDEQGKDHDETLHKVLQICRQENLKLHKDFRCTSISFFGKIVSQQGASLGPRKVQAQRFYHLQS